jgi:hypothetical protein
MVNRALKKLVDEETLITAKHRNYMVYLHADAIQKLKDSVTVDISYDACMAEIEDNIDTSFLRKTEKLYSSACMRMCYFFFL